MIIMSFNGKKEPLMFEKRNIIIIFVRGLCSD